MTATVREIAGIRTVMINANDRQHNAQLAARANTDFHVGETLVLDGEYRVKITEVLPKGSVVVSAAKGWLPDTPGYGPVVCTTDIYRYVGASVDAPASGQTSARHLCRPQPQEACAA